MKKTVAIFLALFLLSQAAVNAQTFQKGDMVANLGVGLGWYSYGYGASSLPAISLSLEKGIKDIENVGPLSIGGIVGFKHATYATDYVWNDIILAARGAIHYDLFKVEKLDTYGGAALGVRLQSYSYPSYFGVNAGKTNYTHGLFALYVGGRYYFSDTFAGFAELGYGLGYLTLGLSYKFN
jgi:hypothetical protein